MARVFVSYKRDDYERVIPLVKRIEQGIGEECWIDLKGIESSVQFQSVICDALDACSVVLFMHSRRHLGIDYENDWTVKELRYAQEEKKRIVLIKLDDAPLKNLFLLNFGGKNNIDGSNRLQVENLIRDLKNWLPTLPRPADHISDTPHAVEPSSPGEPALPAATPTRSSHIPPWWGSSVVLKDMERDSWLMVKAYLSKHSSGVSIPGNLDCDKLPFTVAKGVSREQAEEIKKELERLGCKVYIA